MNIIIEKPPSGGEVKAIASKSHAHRMLICAALADKESFVRCTERCDDIDATVECLKSMGADITHDGTGFHIKPIEIPVSKKLITQVCGESGATLRFLLPVCGALGIPAKFIMQGSVRQRPTSSILDQLSINGCEITMSNGAISCSGQLQSGEFNLQGNVSTQFLSGLLFALPLCDGESIINVEGKVEPMPYVTLTLNALRDFGISVNMKGARAGGGAVCFVQGPQKYISRGNAAVESDWANAAVWLSAGALGGDGITCSGLNLGSSQGDMAILRQIEKFGAAVEYEGNRVTIKPSETSGIQFNAADTPDLVPMLALIASVSDGETFIKNSEQLRVKESNRLHAVAQTLNALGADVTERKDGLSIRGERELQGGAVTSYGDHRIVMMTAIASIVCKNPVTIEGADAVNKSYPGFFEDFKKLGGEIAIL